MTALTVFDFESQKVRTSVDESGNMLYVAKDICKALGLKSPESAYRRIDSEDIAEAYIEHASQRRRMKLVNESGLYSLIFQSEKETARKFKKWITSDVLPTLRKTGSYNIGGKTWLVARQENKHTRKITTDIYKIFVEYAREQGSSLPEFYYPNLTKMINTALIELAGPKPKNLRDELNIVQLQAVSVAETIVSKCLVECMAKQLPYKSVYQIAKQKIETYSQSVGKTLLGSNDRQCLGII